MPVVAPLRGLQYATDRFGADLTDLVCPPYDVISGEDQSTLLARHERNAVRLELNAAPEPHGSAAAALADWRADGTLVQAAEPSVHRYTHGSRTTPEAAAVRAVIARVLLEPWGGGVRPHEHTMPGPKADRLALLRATHTQFSPILALYLDRSAAYDELIDGAWTDARHARDADGLVHALASPGSDAGPDALMRYLSAQTLYIADGHHRYETALAYQAEVRSDPDRAEAPPGSVGADWIMVAMVNAEREPLEIQPTHRLVLDAEPSALRGLVESDARFAAVPVAPDRLAEALDERAGLDPPVFGLVLSRREGYILVGDPAAVGERMRREPGSDAVRGLDLSVLHAEILGDRLDIGPAELAAGKRLAYTRSPADAIDRVARGEAVAALLVRPTRLDQLASVASSGDVMPQKSTYFYPKLLTGMIFNPLED